MEITNEYFDFDAEQIFSLEMPESRIVCEARRGRVRMLEAVFGNHMSICNIIVTLQQLQVTIYASNWMFI